MAVAVAAEHLAVGGDGAAAIAPRGDVVGFHFVQLEVRAAEGTDTVLTLVGLKPRVVVECANAKEPFVAVQYVLPDSAFLLDVAVRDELGDALLKCLRVGNAVAIFVACVFKPNSSFTVVLGKQVRRLVFVAGGY